MREKPERIREDIQKKRKKIVKNHVLRKNTYKYIEKICKQFIIVFRNKEKETRNIDLS